MLRKLGKSFYYIIIIGFLCTAIWQAFEPFIFHGKEVQQVRHDAKMLIPGNIGAMLENQEQKPTILFIFASWCASCAEMGHTLSQLSAGGELSEANTIFLSLDDNEADFARYFVMNGYHQHFTPYMLDQRGKTTLENVLALAGSRLYGTAIPYIGVYDGKGHMAREELGSVDADTLRSMLASARPAFSPIAH